MVRTIVDIKQAIEIGTTLSYSWFRGHNKEYNNLAPKLFRAETGAGFNTKMAYELKILSAFRDGAPAIQNNLPSNEDRVSWLFLSQHYGLPTRLLDWTKNILIALYFAVEDAPEENGELWAMYPFALNRHHGQANGMPLLHNPILNYYAWEPWCYTSAFLLKKLDMKKPPFNPLAVEPPMTFNRIVAQDSVFTIHPTPELGNSIQSLLTDERELVKYLIPKQHKEKLRRDLYYLGIRRGKLFLGLDSLASDIIYDTEVIAYSPPTPPSFPNEPQN
jgi:hypothetical protein